MLLHIIARGKIGRSPEADLVDRYLKRVTLPTRVTELPDRGGKLLIAFGAMTRPHMMARAMLAEQLWRATSILANHPYHREG